MTTPRTPVACGLLALSLAAAPAWADDDDCDVPVRHWQSRDAVLRLAAQQGWQVQRLKIDDGCYELRGTDAMGREFKAKLDPATLRVVKMKQRDRDQDRDRDRERDRDRQRSGAAAPGTPPPATITPAQTPAAAPHLTPGTTPRGQIE